jgi:hypothetical protein
VVEDVLKFLNKRYGKEAPLVLVTRGKVHDYLGITIDFSEDGKVKIIMEDYIKDMLEELPADMAGKAATPAADHLFTVNDKPVLLNKEKSDMSCFIHHHTAKLLFLSKRARPDIQTTVAFLTTRVRAPDEDDYKKLGRCMKKYLRGSAD